jgi:PAS domain S-box-containing protein
MKKSTKIDRGTLDALSASIAIIDEKGLIIAVNKAWRDFAEANHPAPTEVCEGADYLGACDSAQGLEAAQAAEIAAELRAMIKRERDSLICEYPCHSPDVQRWFCARATIFPGEGSARLVIVHENITERIRADQELRSSELRYREIFENSLLGISETNAEGQLIRANRAYARLYGYEDAEGMIGEIQDVGRQLYAHPEDRKEVLGVLADKGYMEPREMELRRRDGSLFRALVSARAMRNEAGELIGYHASHIDISDRKRAEDELRASREMMRTLASRAQSALENERTSTARKIHDLLSQILTRLKIDLVWLQRRLENPDGASPAKALSPRVAEMIGMADEAVSTVQRIATELRPAVLDSLGLGAALVWLASEFQKHSEISCHASVPEGELLIDKDVATAAFRIAQESLSNAVRHSSATEVHIRFAEEAEQQLLIIHDDGVGIDPAKLGDPQSIGLAGMRERALLLGGVLEIRSDPGRGTTVEARFPRARVDLHPEVGS